MPRDPTQRTLACFTRQARRIPRACTFHPVVRRRRHRHEASRSDVENLTAQELSRKSTALKRFRSALLRWCDDGTKVLPTLQEKGTG